jgi:choline dehydrogenase-like flavoprotein
MSNRMPATEFDYVIVGAGSAGCVIANRLSADPSCRVCLVEGGVSDRTPRIQVPAGVLTLHKSERYAYQYKSVPQPRLDNRQIATPRGRALGGSSSMNSMIYIRGHRSDYDKWAAMGCSGWAYADVLPFFKRSERNMNGQDPNYHGTTGELLVDRARDPNVLSRYFVEAGKSLQIPENTDFNGSRLEGVGIYDLTQKNGQRLSSYRAFVHPVLHRKNLTLLVGWTVNRIDLDGVAAVGVTVSKEQQEERLSARKEIILAAGAYGSPELLMRSGIGDRSELVKARIKPAHHLPGVGKNLQDHIDAVTTYRSHWHKSLGVSWKSLPEVLSAPFKYLGWRKGWLTTNYVEAGGFARTRYADEVPDVQFHFVPAYRSLRGRLFEWGHGFAVHTCLLRPKSRGRVYLTEASNRPPQLAIDFNFLDDPQDGLTLTEGLRLARRILNAPPFDEIRGREWGPGSEKVTNEQLMSHIKTHARTVFHPSGTCRMGTAEDCVVAPDLKVRGLEGLRVADASIMPLLVSGNTNAPSIMIGERCADFILKAQ